MRPAEVAELLATLQGPLVLAGATQAAAERAVAQICYAHQEYLHEIDLDLDFWRGPEEEGSHPKIPDAQVRKEMKAASTAAANLRAALEEISLRTWVTVEWDPAATSEQQTHRAHELLVEQVQRADQVLSNALKSFSVKRGKPTKLWHEARFISKACKIWREATGEWPVATKTSDGLNLSPLYGTIARLIPETHASTYERALKAVKSESGPSAKLRRRKAANERGEPKRDPRQSHKSS